MSQRFDKFTERAKKVLVRAQEEAQRFNHNYIGTEHLLLGLVREGEGIAAKVLSNLRCDVNKVRSAVEFIIGRGDRMVIGDISLTPRAKKVIELAVEEARRLNHNYIGTEHLLLGLVREGEGIAAGVLESLGANLESVREQIIAVVGQTPSQSPRAGPQPESGPRFGAPATETVTCRLDHAATETLDLLVALGAFPSRSEAVDRLLAAALHASRDAAERLAGAHRRSVSTGEERGRRPPAGPTMLPVGV